MIETLGSTTVICTDKTGTLTQNRMSVQHVLTTSAHPGADWRSHPAAAEVLGVAVLASDASSHRVGEDLRFVGDPTETALLRAAAEAGTDLDQLRASAPRTASLPFDSARGWMASRHGEVVLAKGALERLLPRCSPPPWAGCEPDWLREAEALAGAGMRVLAVARGPAPAADGLQDADVHALQLLGLVAMEDPPRPTAADAVAACQDAGIQVKMITGDHPATAAAIARQVGIRPDGEGPLAVVRGVDLAAMDDEAFARAAATASVFARVEPEQKLRLVRALQGRGHVVAMTGDGVNDAPALRQADIGVAMGVAGTEAAKQAADVVLTDDDFSTIEAAVEEGRATFDNLVKFLVFALPTNVGQALVVVVGVVLGVTLPLSAVQILWINLVTAVGLGLVLAAEPQEDGLMRRAPRAPAAPLLDRALALRVLVVGLVLTAVAFGAFELALRAGEPVASARTAAANAFLLAEIGYLLLSRSLHGPLRRARWLDNRWLVAVVAAVLAVQAGFTAVPLAHEVFETALPGTAGWLASAGAAAAGIAAVWLAVTATRQVGRGAQPS